ncbi:MAG TPA: AraC family transcriptional regulator [Polyangiaceae bacterium]|nr:AraC family transcriptional regulator [Polyangiaceae bacterium]
MSTRAKNSSATDDSVSGTMLAALVQGNLQAAGAFGFDIEALSAAASLTPTMLADPDARVAVERHIELWEAIARDPRALEFGLWLGKSFRLETLGVIGWVMRHTPTLRAALGCLERFQSLLGDGVAPRIVEREGRVVLSQTEPPRIARLQALSLAAPVGTVALLRELAELPEGEPVALEVAFQHPALPDEALAELQAALNCPLHFDAEETRLVLPSELLERPVRAPDPGLGSYLERHAETLQGRLRPAGSSFSARVREHVVPLLREGEPDQAGVARALATSERTLQRRLQEEGITFAQLLDEVRSELARGYLADPTLAIFEVAFLLGYSEPSAFNRAFRRWTGKTPSDFRRGA